MTKVVEKLKEIIENIGTKKNGDTYHIDYGTLQHSDVEKVIKSASYHDMIDANSLSSIIYSKTESYLRTNNQNPDLKAVAHKLAKEVDDYAESVPIQYQVVLPIPGSEEDVSEVLSSTLEVSAINDGFDKKYVKEVPYGNGLSGGALSRLLANQTYKQGAIDSHFNALIIRDSGFVDNVLTERYIKYDPMHTLKSFVALHLVNKSMYVSFHRYLYRKQEAYAYHIYDKEFNFIRTATESYDDFALIYSIFYVNDKELIKRSNHLFVNLFKKHKTSGSDAFIVSLRNSLYWYYESEKTEYQHLKIINIVSAFDAFFKEHVKEDAKKERISDIVTTGISDYGIAKEYLDKLYRLRNSIIHGTEPIAKSQDYKKEQEYTETALMCSKYLKTFIRAKVLRFENSI